MSLLKRLPNILIAAVFLAPFMAACQSTRPAPARPWQYADLRLLGAPSEDISPSQDLIALSSRELASDLQIRLDLLDLTPDLDYDLYLAFDSQPGGGGPLPLEAGPGLPWDVLVSIPALGDIQALTPAGSPARSLKIRVYRDSEQDTLTIHLDRKALSPSGGVIWMEAITALPGSPEPADRLGPVSTSGRPPQATPLLIGFWNSFPAYSPAQALRRWNGAHSGPASSRHGLDGLVSAVQETGAGPVYLLDLKQPAALSALDYVGGRSLVQRLAIRGLLVLPDALPPLHLEHGLQANIWAVEQMALDSRDTARSFDLRPSPVLFAPSLSDAQTGAYRVVLARAGTGPAPSIFPGAVLVTRQNDRLVFALPETGTGSLLELETGGALALRRLLAEAAAYNALQDHPVPLFLGGDLAKTLWGSPPDALDALSYISSRPWLQLLGPADLASFQPGESSFTSGTGAVLGTTPLATPETAPLPSGLTPTQVEAAVLESLQTAPPGPLADLAWQSYQALLAPAWPSTENLAPLRAAYAGQIGHILAAARWASEETPPCPAPETACSYAADLDWDGLPEYVLASDSLFAVFEAEGAYLTYAFSIERGGEQGGNPGGEQGDEPGGIHQWIGPSSQFFVGLGDPSMWKPERGIAGDPGQIRGAFSDIPGGHSTPRWDAYTVSTGPGELVFSSPNGGTVKLFRLEGNSLVAVYRTDENLRLQIPLALDPWLRFAPRWGDRYNTLPATNTGGWAWGIRGGISVQVESTAPVEGRGFSDSRAVIERPENPDYQFPPGHFLPFPLALVEITGTGEFTVRLTVSP